DEYCISSESITVNKSASDAEKKEYQGTKGEGGLAVCRVTEIGVNTRLGKIGTSLETIERERTPLQIQIDSFVKKMALIGIVVFLIVWAINFFDSRDVMYSLLKALTLAMSILPEE